MCGGDYALNLQDFRLLFFRARARIPPGHVFMFVGLRGCGVVGLGVVELWVEIKKRREE